MLAVRIIGLVERIPVPEGNEERTRWPHFFRCLSEKLDGYGTYPAALQFCCCQAHGLVTHGSDGYQQRYIDLILHEPLNRGGSCLAHKAPGCRDRSHKGEVPMIYRSNPPSLSKLPNTIDWKREIGITKEAGMIERLTAVVFLER